MAGGRLALDHVTSAALVASCSGASAVQAALELAMSVTSGTPRGDLAGGEVQRSPS